MSTREEVEYARRTDEVEAPGSRLPLQEPVDHAEMLEGPQELQRATEAPKESIDDVVSRLIIHEDKPIENLPTMTAPELKLIGRCVSLSTKQTINGVTAQYYYTGLVSAVTATAVTLMYVNRYTEEDFKLYKEREKALMKAANASAQETAKQHNRHEGHHTHHGRSPSSEIDQDQQHVGVPVNGHSAEGEVGVGHRGALTGQNDGAALACVDAAGSLAPAVKMAFDTDGGEEKAFSCTQDGELDEAGTTNDGGYDSNDNHRRQPMRVQRPPHFRSCVRSVGPLPYVSFLRKSIHNVAFGRDPRSSFYSLFQDPLKQLMDMQYLRMFVRRYLVHTSENNNPRQVPMYAFVTVRGACPSLDHELANKLVLEELPGLMKADRAIEKDKKRNRNHEVRGNLSIQEYRAPPGLFSNTGILFLTHVPQSTFLSAVIIVFFSIIFSMFLAVTLAVIADNFVVSYLSQIMSYFIASLIIWIIAGVVIGLHSVNMHIPLRDDRILMVARAVLTLGSVACVIMTIVMLLNRVSNKNLYNYMVYRNDNLLCEFYFRYQCSGFFSSCTDESYNDTHLCSTCGPNSYYPNTCYHALWSQLQITVIPLLVFAVFILLAVVHTIFQFVKLWLMARALSRRVHTH
jgi:hypothetical protein